MNRRTLRPITKRRLWANFQVRMRRLGMAISHCNPAASICSHLVGKNHTRIHRMIIGAIIMGVGVSISKTGGEVVGHLLPHSIEYLAHWFFDGIGYLGHGIGAMPFVETLTRFEE